MTTAAVDQLRSQYNVLLSRETADARFKKPITASSLYTQVLEMDLRDVTEPGMLPRDLASQVAAEVPHDMLLQVVGARDVTQPLRPCADMSEEEAFFLGSPGQSGGHRNRLLKLVLSDGHHEIPMVELQTHLEVFKTVPLPGEKILVKKGTPVQCGMIVVSKGAVVLAGGGVEQLRNDFLMRRKGIPLAKGAAGAPKFSPFTSGSRPAESIAFHPKHADTDDSHHVRGEGRGRGGRGECHGRGETRGRGEVRGRGDGRGSRGRGRGETRGRSEGRGRGRESQRNVQTGDSPVAPPPRRPPTFNEDNFPTFGDQDDY